MDEGINGMVDTIKELEAENEKLKFRLSNVMLSLLSDEEIKTKSFEIYPNNKDLNRNSARNGWVRGMTEMRDAIKRGNGA
jgi:hypothetical protein